MYVRIKGREGVEAFVDMSTKSAIFSLACSMKQFVPCSYKNESFVFIKYIRKNGHKYKCFSGRTTKKGGGGLTPWTTKQSK